jgi:hypothetical protein
MIISKLNVVRNLSLFTCLLCLSLYSQAQVSFISGELKLSLNKQGSLTELSNSTTGKNYLSTDTLSSLITLLSKNIRYQPSSMKYDQVQKKITLGFKETGVIIDIRATSKATHLVLEIIKAEPGSKIDAIIWGPIPNTISKTIGEIIGVVRDGEISLGIQVLNLKTLGGAYPSKEGSTWARGIAAVPAKWGSKLQAYSINRDRERLVDAWGELYKDMPVKALKGETVVGSKIAVFTCKEPQTFDRLEQIEIAENLPHPTIKGVWFKKSNLYGKSYMISSYGEKDIDEMIGYTKRAGLVSLYHEGPFKSWGNFVLNPEQFPNGKNGLKNCVDKAHAAGLYLGMHTLTNFINTNDPYVTPVPDNRLSFTGTSTLNRNIDADQNTIEVISPEFYNDEKGNNNSLTFFVKTKNLKGYVVSTIKHNVFCNQDANIKKEDVEVFIKAGTLSKNTSVGVYINKLGKAVVGNKDEDLLKAFFISVKIPTAIKGKEDKMVLMNENTCLVGKYENGWFKTESKSFGMFGVSYDTLAPTIVLPTSKKKTSASAVSKTHVGFTIADNLSGIADYNVYVNDVWQIAEYDAKLKTVTCYFTETAPKTLKIEVIDRVGNKAVVNKEL